MRAFVNAVAVAALVFATACFSPNFGQGKLACGTNNLCPDGQKCAFDGKCYSVANLPQQDMAEQPTFVGSGQLGALAVTGTDMSVANLVFNVDDGSIKLGSTVLLAAMQPGFSIQPQHNGGPEVAMWEFDTFSTTSDVTISQGGATRRVIAIVAKTKLEIDGKVDLRAFGGSLGLAGTDGKGIGAGADGVGGGKGSPTPGRGGGGGGHSTAGSSVAMGGGAGGGKYGDDQMSSIFVGAGGGGGGCDVNGLNCSGGNGSGAIALLGKEIIVNGELNVDGNTPSSSMGTGAQGGGGGGSGGAIMLSGDQVTLGSGHKLFARGGSGGSGVNSGTNGGNGSAGRIWIGVVPAHFTVVNVNADPDPFKSGAPLTDFPRPAK